MARRRTEPAANPARGAALVVVAVVIGLFLLRNGLDTSEAVTADGNGSGGDSSNSTDDGAEDTTTTTVAARSPGDVPTIVLNDSGVGGAAGKYSEALASAGYPLTNPEGANADATARPGDAALTEVLFAPGFEAEAAAVALVIGAPDTVVPAPLPATPPGPLAGASVVVVIGLDMANLTPTTVATTTTAAT